MVNFFSCRLVVWLLISHCSGTLLTAGPKDPSRLWFSNFVFLKLRQADQFLSYMPGNLAHFVQSSDRSQLFLSSSKQSTSELARFFLGVPWHSVSSELLTGEQTDFPQKTASRRRKATSPNAWQWACWKSHLKSPRFSLPHVALADFTGTCSRAVYPSHEIT